MSDVRYALRQLVRRPLFTGVVVGTLALGIGASTAVFSVVRGVLLRPLPYETPEDLVMVFRTVPRFGFERSTASYPDYADWRAQATSVESMGATQWRRAVLTGAGDPVEVFGVRATASLWTVLGLPPAAGRVFGPDDDRPGTEAVIVLSEGLARRAFGSAADAVGRSVTLDGERATVIGVMPDAFYYPTPDAEYWEPLRADPAAAERDANFLSVIARLAAGATIERAQTELADLAARIDATAPGANEGYGMRVEARHGVVVRDVRTALWVLLGAVTLVLAIAWANVGNLLLVRSVARRREFAVRAALGGSRAGILRSLAAEGAVTSLAAGALGLLLAVVLSDLVVALAPDLPRAGEVRLDLTVFAWAALLSVLTGVLFALVPASRILRQDVQSTLRADAAGTTAPLRGRRFQGALLVTQIGLAVVLVVGSTVLARHFLALTASPLGFRSESALTARLSLPFDRYPEPAARRAFFSSVIDQVEALPGITDAAATVALPFSGATFGRVFVLEDHALPPPGDEPSADYSVVAGDYFRAMSIPIVRGRAFGPADDAEGLPVAVINEAMARRFWPGEDPIGRRFKPGEVTGENPWVTVVGVAGDVRTRSLDEEVPAGWYQPLAQVGWPTEMFLVARTAGPSAALAPALRRAVQALDAALPVADIRTLAGRIGDSVAEPRMRTLVLGGFAGLASLLALLGVSSTMAFIVAQRTRDLGIRMALGADRRRVVRAVLRPGLLLVLAGAAVGVAGAALSDRVLRSLVSGVPATDPAVLAAVAGFLGTCAVLGCWLPARRAARIDPMEALRDE